MKYRILSVAKDGFSLIMNFAINMAIWFTLVGALEVEVAVWKVFVLFLVQVFFYVVRKFLNNIVAFTVVHLAAFLTFSRLLKADVKETVLIVLLLAGYTIYSFVCRLVRSEPGEKEYSPAMAAVVMILSTFILSYVHCEWGLRLLPVWTLCYITFYFPVMYIKKFTWFDFMSRKTITHMPTGNLVKATAPYIAGMSLFYVVTAIVCLNERFISAISATLKSWLKRFLVWILSFIDTYEGETELEPMGGGPAAERFPFGELMEDAEPSKLMQILEKVLIYATVVAVMVGVVYLIYKLISLIISRFHGIDLKAATDLTEDYIEEREVLEIKKEKKKEKRSFFAAPSDRIRGLYIKIVNKNAGDSVDPGKLTAREFIECFDESLRECAMEFVAIYEKARYSPYQCTKDDLKAAKASADVLIK